MTLIQKKVTDQDGESTEAKSDSNAEAGEKEDGQAQSDSNAEDTEEESGKTEEETGNGEGTEEESEWEDRGVKADNSKDTLTSDSDSEKEKDTCAGETPLMDPSGKKDELDSDNGSCYTIKLFIYYRN